MPWTDSSDLVDTLGRKWRQGVFLRACLGGEPVFPLRLPLKYPRAGELADGFAAAKDWVRRLESRARSGDGAGYELEYREINHRQLGRQSIPVAAVFRRLEDVLGLIGKTGEAKRFRRLADKILAARPELLPWLEKRPLRALEHYRDWPRLLDILAFLRAHPRPGIYLRQLDLAGVDTKFIEKRKKLLTELLDQVLPPGAVDREAVGAGAFAQRYGFTAIPVRVRFRILDRNLRINGLADLQIPVADFAALDLPVERVFITENIINGLAFPDFPGAIVIFGLGYGLDRLAGVDWLRDKKIYYWGDLDSHGFAMLDQLRSYFPRTTSLLMDRATLMAHQQQWGTESRATDRDLPRLTREESRLYDEIRNNRLADGLRLEQERISYSFLRAALEKIRQDQT